MKRKQKPPECTVELRERSWDMELDGEVVLRCLLVRPELRGTWRGIGAINRYYRREERVWQRCWEKEVYLRASLDLADRRGRGRPFSPWQVQANIRITRQKDGLLSLIREGREQAGNGRPLVACRGDTWSLASGAPVALATVLGGMRRWKRKMLAHVEEQVKARVASGESLLDRVDRATLRRFWDGEQFCLTETGVQVFFPMYTLGPGAEGIPTFELPLSR